MLVYLKSVIFLAQLCVLCIGSPVAPICGDMSLGYTYNNLTGRCYKFHSHGKKWEDAELACKTEGGNLATPNDWVEYGVLQKLLTDYPFSKIRAVTYLGIIPIGIRKGPSGAWLTVDGGTPEYTSWSYGYPKEGENYAYMQRSGRWRTFSDEPLAFICEKPADRQHIVVSDSFVATSCGDTSLGYTYNNLTRRCYKFHSHGKKWEAAGLACKAEDASVAVPNDWLENGVLQKQLQGYIGSSIDATYTGIMPIGIRKGPSGVWLTVDGQTPEYTKWLYGYPKEGENYAYMLHCGNWRTFSDEPLAFICEKPAQLLRPEQGSTTEHTSLRRS